MSEAAVSIRTVYPDPAALPDFAEDFPALTKPDVLVAPHADVVRAPHDVVAEGEALIEDGAEAGDEVAIDLGDIATEVTAFVLRNNTAQDLAISINGGPGASSALAAEVTAQLAILDAFTDEDDAEDIVAAIAAAKAALEPLAAAAVAAAWTMPPGAVLAYASPTTSGEEGTPITAISVIATDEQTGDQAVAFRAFGYPEEED